MLKGFEQVSEDEKRKAEEGFSISRNRKLFETGDKFKVVGYDFEKAVFIDKNGNETRSENSCPVLKTTSKTIFLSMITREKPGDGDKVYLPNGTFDKLVRQIVAKNEGKSDGTILKAIVEATKDKEVVVTRVSYNIETEYGRRTKDLYHLNFVEANKEANND